MPHNTRTSDRLAKRAEGRNVAKATINETAELNDPEPQKILPGTSKSGKTKSKEKRSNQVPNPKTPPGKKMKFSVSAEKLVTTATFDEDDHEIEFEVEAQGSEFLSDGEVGSTDSASESDGENSSQESAKVQKKRHRSCAADHSSSRSRSRSHSGH